LVVPYSIGPARSPHEGNGQNLLPDEQNLFLHRETHYDFTGQSRRGRTARIKRAESIARLASSQPMYSALKAIGCQEA